MIINSLQKGKHKEIAKEYIGALFTNNKELNLPTDESRSYIKNVLQRCK